MKLLPANKNDIARIFVFIIPVTFFVAGMFDTLNNFLVKILLFLGFAALISAAITYALKNEEKENRLEDNLQDDSH